MARALGSGAADPRFRVAVDGVRIDAVVTDKKNNVVRDLGADDFEILQDGKPQKVTFAQFVSVLVTSPAASRPESWTSGAAREMHAADRRPI